MKVRKYLLIYLAVIMILLCPLSAFAEDTVYTNDSAKISFTVPDGLYTFTSDSSLTDPQWAALGIDDPSTIMTDNKDYLAYFIGDFGKVNIYLSKKTSDSNTSTFDLSILSESEKETLLDKFQSTESDTITAHGEWYDVNGQPFIKFSITQPQTDSQSAVSELQYLTIINGYAVSLSTHNNGETIDENSAQILKTMVDSITFTERLDKNATTEASNAYVMQSTITFAAIALIIVVIIIVSRKFKKEQKQLSVELGGRIAKFRMEHENPETLEDGELKFENETKRSLQMIHNFAFYTTILNHPFASFGTIAISLIGLIYLYYLKAEWWLLIILIAVLIYCIYKLITAPSKFENTLKRSFAKEPNQTGMFKFYDNYFYVSGVQQKTIYPYFQITSIREYKGIYYLYMGDMLAYFVDKNSFKKGTPEEFFEFVRNKLKYEKYRTS